MGGKQEPSTSQKGKIAELYVASILMAASNGRLSAFVPLSDDDGVDLVILDKKTKTGIPVQVKSWLKKSSGKNKNVQFDVGKSTFSPSSKAALIGLVLDLKTMAMEVGWLMPMDKVPELGNGKGKVFALSPSRDTMSQDKYAPYRYDSVQSLTDAVLGMITEQGR